jgi:hypothetical protein
MTIGRFKAQFGSRISARRRASPLVPATALPRNAHNGIRSLASAHDK